MRKNLFMNLSSQALRDCFNSYIKVQIKKEEPDEIFSRYLNEYIWMLENTDAPFKNYDEKKKYHIGFSIAEKDLLYVMAKQYLIALDLLERIKVFVDDTNV